jgi:hypothetical protein
MSLLLCHRRRHIKTLDVLPLNALQYKSKMYLLLRTDIKNNAWLWNHIQEKDTCIMATKFSCLRDGEN